MLGRVAGVAGVAALGRVAAIAALGRVAGAAGAAGAAGVSAAPILSVNDRFLVSRISHSQHPMPFLFGSLGARYQNGVIIVLPLNVCFLHSTCEFAR